MRFPTEIRVKTTKRSEVPELRFTYESAALVINQEGHLGYHHNGVLRWYSSGVFLSQSIRDKPHHIILPCINLVGSDTCIVGQIEYYAQKLLSFTVDSTGQYPEGTLYLLDLWGESDSRTGTSSFDLALVLSTATFDWTGVRKVPAYLGWTGLEVPDLPSRPRKSRYQRDPVI